MEFFLFSFLFPICSSICDFSGPATDCPLLYGKLIFGTSSAGRIYAVLTIVLDNLVYLI